MILIVAENPDLARIWARHLERQKCDVAVATSAGHAVEYVGEHDVDVIVLDLMLERGSAFAVADFASYRRPAARVVFVTNTSFFSDGSIFRHIPNACAFLPSGMAPEDLAAVIDHYGVVQ